MQRGCWILQLCTVLHAHADPVVPSPQHKTLPWGALHAGVCVQATRLLMVRPAEPRVQWDCCSAPVLRLRIPPAALTAAVLTQTLTFTRQSASRIPLLPCHFPKLLPAASPPPSSAPALLFFANTTPGLRASPCTNAMKIKMTA